MKRAIAITLLLVALVGCNMSCASFKAAEQSGKTDATIDYYQKFLVGAQMLLPMFGAYAAPAQVAINSAFTALELYRKASDMVAVGKLDAAQLVASIQAVQNQIVEINALGNSAGIGK
jgi:hypothetical protein